MEPTQPSCGYQNDIHMTEQRGDTIRRQITFELALPGARGGRVRRYLICARDGGGECGRTESMSRIRIADDPDSWGTPQISSIEPVKPREDPSKCSGCGVDWMHHLADLCPIPPGKLSD